MSLRAWLAETFSRKTSLGERGEEAAAQFLKRKGYRILARRVDSRLGELDIVAVSDRTLVFVEVKTRTTTGAGHPAEAIDDRKQRRMTHAALSYLKAQRLLNHAARFDVVAVTWPDKGAAPVIEHYENAFSPIGIGQFFS